MTSLAASSGRYLVVGGSFALLNATTLIALDYIHIHYFVALLIAIMLWVPASYWVHLRFTYRVKGGGRSFVRYFGAQLVNLPLATMLLFTAHDLGGLAMIWAAPIVTTIMLIYNMVASFWAVRTCKTTQGCRA